jgi:hypothetical protein
MMATEPRKINHWTTTTTPKWILQLLRYPTWMIVRVSYSPIEKRAELSC